VINVDLVLFFMFLAVLFMLRFPVELESDLQSKVSRVAKDLQANVQPIEAYRLDHGAYPVGATGQPMIWGLDKDLKAVYFPLGSPDFPRLPTFPHGYPDWSMNANPRPFGFYLCCSYDAFCVDSHNRPLYYSMKKETREGWILVSAGPDRDYDISPPKVFDPSTTQPSPALLRLTYDPTNGTMSNGDIWLIGPRREK
jgi:hypothetical protein